ncbi:MAG TPA: hypothetical protein VMW73_16725 [Spirochaetia bacterium]|nr:hypothetical protein [Spirochaetia bacterium]
MNRRTVKRTVAVTAVLAFVLAGSGIAFGQGWGPNGGNGRGPGMMYGNDDNGQGYGPGMMGGGYGGGPGYGRGQGYGRGMMGGGYGPGMAFDQDGTGYGYNAQSNATRIDASRINTVVEGYLATLPGKELQIAEIVDFQYNYYVRVKEKGAATYSMELLVNPYSGRVVPVGYGRGVRDNDFPRGGRGPWAAGPGTYSGTPSQAAQNVSSGEAQKIAADFVKRFSPNDSVTGEAQFPGHYSMFITDNGKIVGVVSVDASSGTAFYHRWLGTFLKTVK